MTYFPRMISFNRLLAFLRQRPRRKNDSHPMGCCIGWESCLMGFYARKKWLRLHCTHFNGVVVIAGIGSFFSDMSLQNLWNLQQKFRKKIISEIFLRFIHTSVTKKRVDFRYGSNNFNPHPLRHQWMDGVVHARSDDLSDSQGNSKQPMVFLMVVSIRWCSPNNYIKFILVGISTMKPSHLKKVGCLGC